MPLSSGDLASLRFFAATARLLSFKHAARELHVTQGAVSQHIKHLETSLGCKLFYRLPRQIKLTEYGEKYAAIVMRVLADLDAGAEEIAARTISTQRLRVRAGPSFALSWLVPRLGRFYESSPEIKLDITGGYGHFDPANWGFDVAIELVKGNFTGMHVEPFMDEYLLPVCSPEYMSRHPFLKRPADLARCTLLHDSHAWSGMNESAEWSFWLQEAAAREVDSAQGRFFTLASMAIEAALAHQGVALGRLALVEPLLKEGRLVEAIPMRVTSPGKYCVIHLKEDAQRPGLQNLIRWLHTEAQLIEANNRSPKGS